MPRKPSTPQSSEPPEPNSAAPPTVTSSPPTPPPPWVRIVQLSGASPSQDQLKALVHEQVTGDLAGDPISAKYNIMLLYDAVAIARTDADLLYRALNKSSRDKPLLLILDS